MNGQRLSALHRFFILSLASAAMTAIGPGITFAHKPSDSYLRINGGGERLQIEWDIALKDLEFLVGLDSNQNGEITWRELQDQEANIAAHAISRLRIAAGHKESSLTMEQMLVSQHSDGAYATLRIISDLPGSLANFDLEYRLLFDADPTHRGLVLFQDESGISTHVLSPENPVAKFRTGSTSLAGTFVTYVREGIWHIWIGTDHILFLLSLLLPAVWVLRNNDTQHSSASGDRQIDGFAGFAVGNPAISDGSKHHPSTTEAGLTFSSLRMPTLQLAASRTQPVLDNVWQPVDSFKPACMATLKIVSVFTIAHSLTLWLAVMEYVTPPSRIVESVVAFSIVVTALNNLYPRLRLSGWSIAFVFGLIHGFGFANVLLDLGLSSVALAISLLGFNVGVELGQIAIVLVFLPIAFLIRKSTFYRWVIFRAGSVIIALIAAIWTYERLCNVEILGF